MDKANSQCHHRLRVDIWEPIANELRVPRESVEAMHWAIGKDGMALRAKGSPIKTRTSQPFVSITPVAPTRNGAQGRFHSIKESQNRITLFQNFEDRRTHHFSATKPPQLTESRLSIKKDPTIVRGGPDLTKGLNGQKSLDTTGPYTLGLTIEGKRQAQAAGDKLRARTSPSRSRRVLMTTNDNSSHQNRWADYKTPSSVFVPNASIESSKDISGSSLTSEGKRQAQVAGDKLRLRTNPIRHSRPSRGSISDHGISKNRWSSYGGSRVTRFDERHDNQLESKEQSQFPFEKAEPDRQPSLLEVFETELAKKLSDTDLQKTKAEGPIPGISVVPPEIQAVTQSPVLESDATMFESNRLPQPVKPLVDGFKVINEHLQSLTNGKESPSQELSNVIGKSVRTAFGGFNTFLQSISGGIQEASHLTRQVADRTREFDGGLLRDAAAEFLKVEKGVAALAKEVECIGQKANEIKYLNVSPAATASDSLQMPAAVHSLPDGTEDNGPSLSRHVNATSSQVSERSLLTGKFEVPVESEDEEDDTLPLEKQTTSRASVAPDITVDSSDGNHHVPSVAANQSGLQRVREATVYPTFQPYREVTTAGCGEPTARPSVATRFPTLAQFEGQSFAPSFPSLPSMSMEPLVPQRVNLRSPSKTTEAPPRLAPLQDSLGLPQVIQDQHIQTNPAVAANELLTMNGINPGNLSDTQFASFQQQNPQVQQKSIQVYAQNLARNQRNQQFVANAQRDENSVNSKPNVAYEHTRALWLNPSHRALEEGIADERASGVRGNRALQDYQIQLMLLKQQQQKKQQKMLSAQDQKDMAAEGIQAAKNQIPCALPLYMTKPVRVAPDLATKIIDVQPKVDEENRLMTRQKAHLQQQQQQLMAVNQAQSNPGNSVTQGFGIALPPHPQQQQRQEQEPATQSQYVRMYQDQARRRQTMHNEVMTHHGPQQWEQMHGQRFMKLQAQQQQAMQQTQMQAWRNATQQSTHQEGNEEKLPEPIQPKRSYIPVNEKVASLRDDNFRDIEARHGKDSPIAREYRQIIDKLVDRTDSVTGEEHSEEDQRDQAASTTDNLAAADIVSFLEEDMLSKEESDRETDRNSERHEAAQSSEDSKKSAISLPSAARLVEPFDPLDAIPLAQPRLTEGIRRNATVAGTDNRHNARRRRPYSEAFDGKGRVEWGSFLKDSRHGLRNIPIHGSSDRAAKHDIPIAKNDQPTRSSFSEVDRKISDCIKQLKDLGFLKNERGSEERLAMYAQAAGGNLVEAIDMIDEERRAYNERS